MSLDDVANAVGMSEERLGRIEPRMRTYIERFGYAGISVVLARRGQVVFGGHDGTRDRETGLPMTADRIHRPYSMTKPVAAVATMTLVADGLLRLTHPVERAPNFRSLRVLDEAGTLHKPQRPVTVQDLLTHTSGMRNEFAPGSTCSNRYSWASAWSRPQRGGCCAL